MKISHIEVHRYAPELNRVYFKKGGSLPCPWALTIQQVRERFKPIEPGLGVVITSYYDDPKYKWLNKVIGSGRVKSRAEALRICRENVRAYQKGGPLRDGSILPPNKLKFDFKYV